ncbi:hypothetical protein VM1G_07559 [Cytospora mali]|uniref:Uncharacterized protein n=1 Tax=Cytospora mali TaxID=578113 RepID=A0A194W7W5_CYTMA|nr:hypothetical protein VM1G_07559 [Valsa mali]
MAQPHPTLINLPQPPSNPDTPSEIPGTPTSTTTSLSALSTTAIKDGHRGHALPTTNHRGHHQHASQGSLDAERADRISRLAGLSNVSQLRSPPNAGSAHPANNSPQTTPTSAGFPPNTHQSIAPLIQGAPAYFDSNGQPVAVTKMSTVGTASATESDIDMMSTDTNFARDTEVDSASGYVGTGHTEHPDMDVDEDMTNRSVGQFEQEDNMSDDGSASLVGFGEGANSTISGPIYVRRPLPGMDGLQRSSSGLNEGVIMAQRRQRLDREDAAAAAERRDARMMDGVASDGVPSGSGTADEETFVDTTNSGPVPVSGTFQPGQTSSLRETQHGPNTRHHWNHQQPPTAREASDRAIREQGLSDSQRVSNSGSPGKRF